MEELEALRELEELEELEEPWELERLGELEKLEEDEKQEEEASTVTEEDQTKMLMQLDEYNNAIINQKYILVK